MAIKIAQLFEFIHKLIKVNFINFLIFQFCTILVVQKYKLNLILKTNLMSYRKKSSNNEKFIDYCHLSGAK